MSHTSPKGRRHAVGVVSVVHAYPKGQHHRNVLYTGGENWLATGALLSVLQPGTAPGEKHPVTKQRGEGTRAVLYERQP